jgi:hypothetical protein
MSDHPRSRPRFQPRFTLGLFYLVAFFFLYCLLLVSPQLYEVALSVPPGPEQEEVATQMVREAIRPRFWIALVASVLTTAIGARSGVLPGMRPGV